MNQAIKKILFHLPVPLKPLYYGTQRRLLGILKYFNYRKDFISVDAVAANQFRDTWINPRWETEQTQEGLNFIDNVFVYEGQYNLYALLYTRSKSCYYKKFLRQQIAVDSDYYAPAGYVKFVNSLVTRNEYDFVWINTFNFAHFDILNGHGLSEVIHKIDLDEIIHRAAIHFIPYCNQHPFNSSNINIQGTLNILDAGKSLKNLEKMFFPSTAAQYPICDDPLPETQQTNPLDIYGLFKLAAQHLMNEFYLQTSIPTIICRFFNAFGLNETNLHLIPEIQRQVNWGLRTIELGNLEPKRDFIHTYDMARAIFMLLDQFDSGIDVFNLGSGQEYSVIDVVKEFENQLGEEITIKVDKCRVRKVERMHLLADISKLKAFISWKPEISLSEGIKTLLNVEFDFFRVNCGADLVKLENIT
jgi:UDP-glucose 4-epimerase